MNLDILKGNPKVKMDTPEEKKIYKYLGEFQLKKFTGKEKIELSPSEMQVKYYASKLELKGGIKAGEVVGIDCLERYFIYYCRENKVLYLLNIEFDLNEIFGSDITSLMDLREEKILGSEITFEQGDTLIDNYIEWKQAGKEIPKTDKKPLEGENFDKWFDLA